MRRDLLAPFGQLLPAPRLTPLPALRATLSRKGRGKSKDRGSMLFPLPLRERVPEGRERGARG